MITQTKTRQHKIRLDNAKGQNPVRMKRRQSGLGIIEVLVALVVVSFGVLGMASMQLTGMKHSSGGFNRSKALLFAQSMATRIRINTVAADSQKYAGFDSASLNCDAPPTPYCQTRSGGGATPMCTTDELAAFDQFSVSCGDFGSDGADTGVIGSLPNGSLTVTCLATPCTSDSAYQVNVSWTEGRSRTNSDELVTRRVQVRLRP